MATGHAILVHGAQIMVMLGFHEQLQAEHQHQQGTQQPARAQARVRRRHFVECVHGDLQA